MKTQRITVIVAITMALIVIAVNFRNVRPTNCVETRAGFDLGSGSTKVVVAEIDACKKQVLKILLEQSKKLDVQTPLLRSKENTIPADVVLKEIEILLELKGLAASLGAQKFSGFATEAFRSAKNGDDVIKEISNKTGIVLAAVTQDEETQIARASVRLMTNANDLKLAVWDIGGGSQQFSMRDTNGQLIGFVSKMGCVNFRDLVIEKVKGLKVANVTTPNPLNLAEISQSIEMSQAIAEQAPDSIRKAISQTQVEVVGAGEAHWYSIREQTKVDTRYCQTDLMRVLNDQVGKSDAEINSEFADTDITNVILVLGHMKALGIECIKPAKVNLAISYLF